MRKRGITIVTITIIALILSVSVAAYVNSNVTPANPNNATDNIPTKPTSTPTPKPSLSPIPTLTPTPTLQPVITPAPFMLPDDVKINYQEDSRNYIKDINTTQITLLIQVISDFTTRRTFILYEKNFYLKSNDLPLSNVDSNSTNEILLNEDRKEQVAVTFNVTGTYTGSNYELAYNNPPDILFIWKKL